MPRFVLLHHQLPPGERASHWDLMLERGAALRTWALAESPLTTPEVEATPLPDHRLAYLDYQGPVSGNRGVVSRADVGTYQLVEEREGLLRFALAGERLRGEATLRRDDRETEPSEESTTAPAQRWRLIFTSV